MKRLMPMILMIAAAGSAHAAAWIGPYSVTRFEADGSSIHFVRSEGFSNTESCASPTFIKFEGDEKLVDRALAVALMAKVSGTMVGFYVSGCTAGGYLRGYTIQVLP